MSPPEKTSHSADAASAANRHGLVEAGQRLSRSRLWQWQRRYYGSESTAAWQKGVVPHYVTSNTFIADAYARVALGFLRDCMPALDPSYPIYFVELGAGVGRFGFHFLRQFFARLARSPLSSLRVRYVLTDLVAANVSYYLSHPQLQPFFEAGQLDCATFDVESDHELRLQHSGEVLAPGRAQNPLLVIANYVFDTVPADAFRVAAGQLHESLVTLTAPAPASMTSPDDPTLLSRVELSYEHRDITLPYYEDPSWNQILKGYQVSAAERSILFPCAALDCISRLRTLAGGRLLLLSADKGTHLLEQFERKNPNLALHGSFSVMVNYHAIAEWLTAQGGLVLHADHRDSSLSIHAFVCGMGQSAETRLAFADSLASGGPDDLFLLKKALDYRLDTLPTDQLLALIRLCRCDHKILLGCAPTLKQRLSEAGLGPALRADLLDVIAAAQACHFAIGEEPDPAAALAELRRALEEPPVPALSAPRTFGHRFAQLRLVPPDDSSPSG